MTTLALPVTGMAQGVSAEPLFREDGPFSQLVSSARFYENAKHEAGALKFYRLAVKKAQTDAERAEANLGVARNTLIRYGNPNPAIDGTHKIEAYRTALNQAGAPTSAKIAAHLGIAETQAALGKYDDALVSLAPVLAMAEITAAEKATALLLNGKILLDNKRYDEARNKFAQVIVSPIITPEQKIEVYRTVARSFFQQGNLNSGIAEIAKINALPGFTDEQRADIHIANGKLIADEGQWPAARAEYERVAVLANASAEKNTQALQLIGDSYNKEKQYVKAREAWNQVLGMKGGQNQAKSLWRSIAASYFAEKNYPAAREAYEKRLKVPGLEMPDFIQTFQLIANTHVEEKQYAKAREVLTNITGYAAPATSPLTLLQYKLRQQLDIANVYRSEGDFTKAGEVYVAILQDVPVAKTSQPSFFHQVRDQVQVAADTLATNKDSMAAAYSIYEALEKLYPYEKDDAEAFIGMGNIQVAQGKTAEARAQYQKAYDLRKNYAEGKLAQEKLRGLGG
jgi:tetratricopeptide (TPR) repeat protein